MAEVPENDKDRECDQPPGAEMIASAPPDAQRYRQQATTQQKARESQEPEEVRRQAHNQQASAQHRFPAADFPAQPEKRDGKPHQSHRDHDPVGGPGGDDPYQPGKRQVSRPVREGLPADLVISLVGRTRLERPGENPGIVKMGRAILGRESRDRPDRDHDRQQQPGHEQPAGPETLPRTEVGRRWFAAFGPEKAAQV